ncbi:MAG: hypothetical protein FWF20_11140 [Betaproteobacteria bacterium]|nr:hypothetical protein [Betaproteobacteria bacterium]MCL2887310.1 hypothetical protein [Betaproteobacteria bacterium]
MALSDGQSEEYWKLRDEMLTPKFQLQDYGGTLVALSIGIIIVSCKGWRRLKSPTSGARLLGLAAAAPILTVGAYIFDLLQSFNRGEFPHWADSMGIPLMGAPILLVIMLVWSGAHLAFVHRTYRSEFLSVAWSWRSNWWLLVIATVTAVLVALSAATGQYWYAIAGVAWLYFYVSLAASHRSTHPTQPSGKL